MRPDSSLLPKNLGQHEPQLDDSIVEHCRDAIKKLEAFELRALRSYAESAIDFACRWNEGFEDELLKARQSWLRARLALEDIRRRLSEGNR